MASPAAQARDRVLALEAERKQIESDIKAGLAALGAVGMTAPLIDAEGFPRGDVDLVQVRTWRQRVIMLRNDLRRANDALEQSLIALHAMGPGALGAVPRPSPNAVAAAAEPPGIALVDSVSIDSPAEDAGLRAGDLILSFGAVDGKSAASSGASALHAIAAAVGSSENVALPVTVRRGGAVLQLTLTPRRWSGRGLLGCHVLPAPMPTSSR